MNNAIKKLSITTKILVVILLVLTITESIISIISYINMKNLGEYSDQTVYNFGKYASDNSKKALQTQAETYMKKLSGSIASAANSTLENVNNQVSTISLSISNIYKNRENFQGYIPPFPDISENNISKEEASASEKAFVIDPNNISDDGSIVLAYDPGQYSEKFKENIFRTNIGEWTKLSDDKRQKIEHAENVVSNNVMPKNIKEELSVISNISYIIKPIYEKNPTISSAYVATESGIFYKYSKDSPTVRFDPRKRNWYIDAINAKNGGNTNTVWQSPYIDKETGTLCITCSYAFQSSDGKTAGVVACDMYLSNISSYIINSKIGETGHAFIVDNEGSIVMHPQYNSSYQNSNFNPNPLNTNISQSYRDVINNMKDGKSGYQQATIEEREYYIAYFPMSGPKWTFGITAETNEIVQSANKTEASINESLEYSRQIISNKINNLILWLLLTFIVLCFISLSLVATFSEKIIRPIKKLEAGVKKIGSGDLSVELKAESYDEIGELAIAFNKMAKDLKKHMDDLSETTAEKERIKSELSIAKKIQLSMLPCTFPAFPDRDDFDIYAITDPAKEVGGDFYDFFFVDNSHLALVIADVSGKGISAALFMVISKILIKNQLQAGKSPESVLETVNNQLYENNNADMFVTAFVGIYDIKTGELTFSNAGHNPPLLYRKENDYFELVKTEHEFVLAGIKDKKYGKYKLKMSKDDILFMYTDGVTDAENKDLEMFSGKRLKEILNRKDVKALGIRDMIISIKSELNEFSKGVPKYDDITIMAFKIFKELP